VPLLLCDLDGTLVDRGAIFRRWAAAFAQEHGLDDTAIEWLVAADGDGNRSRSDFAADVCEHFSLGTELTSDSFVTSFIPFFHCLPETNQVLALARAAGWKLAIVTNGGGPMQTGKIRFAQLEPLVDAVCISALEGCAKPDPRFLEIAAERAGCDLKGAWMIGDSDADIGAAIAAGIDSVWLAHDREWSVPDYRPTAVTSTFAEAVDIALG
jgi:putative hydrolase of the HAD superfamily